jgi:hypothetical protein
VPKAKQISAWVEDRPGMIAEVADALGDKGISMRAFLAAVMDGRGFIRVVVDKPAAAKKIFAKHGWKTTEDEVVEVTIPDRPGALAGVAARLASAGINVGYAYVGTAQDARKVNLYLSVPDVKAALKVLR